MVKYMSKGSVIDLRERVIDLMMLWLHWHYLEKLTMLNALVQLGQMATVTIPWVNYILLIM